MTQNARITLTKDFTSITMNAELKTFALNIWSMLEHKDTCMCNFWGRETVRGWTPPRPSLSECCQLRLGCQQAVDKLSGEKIFFAHWQTHLLESTNQNTNVNTKIPKNINRRKFSSGYYDHKQKIIHTHAMHVLCIHSMTLNWASKQVFPNSYLDRE